MDELIKISTSESGNRTVDARELWTKLEVKDRFATWFDRRVKKYSFQESIDYAVRLNATGDNTGFQPIEYDLTIDMAKELSMVEHNAVGRKMRQYFIWAETQYRENSEKQTAKLSSFHDVVVLIGKQKRNAFTEVLKSHGCIKPHHYIQITKQMKGRLAIEPTKPKEDCDIIERMKIAVSEDLAALGILVNEAQGYYPCRDISLDAAGKVQQISVVGILQQTMNLTCEEVRP